MTSLAAAVAAIVTAAVGEVSVEATPVDHHERLVWLATGPGGPLVVKADTDPDRHRREALGLASAHAAGRPVPRIDARIQGDVNVLVIERLAGSALTGADDHTAWSAVGAELARLHDIEPTGETCGGAGTGADERVGHLLAYATGGEVGAEDDRIARGVAFVRDRLAGAAPARQIHGDCQPDHFLLDDERRAVLGVIDFGDAGLGDPLWDVGILTVDHPENAGPVLDGYGDPDLERRATHELPGYHALRCLTDIRWLREHHFDPRYCWDTLARLLDL